MGAVVMSAIVHEISHFLGTRDCMKPLSQGACCYGVDSPGGCSGPDSQPRTPEDAQMFAMRCGQVAADRSPTVRACMTGTAGHGSQLAPGNTSPRNNYA
jgi:hypothetical protein